MYILVACEESQAVTKELRALGHIAYSCDTEPCSGGRPDWHIQQDVLPLLDGYCSIIPQLVDSMEDVITLNQKWDMIIAFPPCTHLSVSGAAWFEEKRRDGRQEEAVHFFMKFLNADCERIAVENPVNIISGKYIQRWFPHLCIRYGLPLKPSQYIQPYEYGSPTPKKTGIWLKNLGKLIPTEIVEPKYIVGKRDGKKYSEIHYMSVSMAKGDRSKLRSKTFPGIAKAMAEQWAGRLI